MTRVGSGNKTAIEEFEKLIMLTHLEVLKLFLNGSLSGKLSEWPQLKDACAWAVNYINKKEGAIKMRFCNLEIKAIQKGEK